MADVQAWERAFEQAATTVREGLRGDRIISLEIDGIAVEVFDGWLGSPALGVIERADVVAGHRFMTLDEVIDFKRHLDRPKAEPTSQKSSGIWLAIFPRAWTRFGVRSQEHSNPYW